MNERIYVCHTFYHVYIACLKELNLPGDRRGQACLVLSTMSNDFGNLKARAERSGLFRQVFVFEEKEEGFFPVLKKYHTDRGKPGTEHAGKNPFLQAFGEASGAFCAGGFQGI